MRHAIGLLVILVSALTLATLWRAGQITIERDRVQPRPANLALDLNAADAPALALLPGVGPGLARAIIAHRQNRGPFRSVEELTSVKGVGPATLRQIRPYVTCGPVKIE